MRYLPQEHYVYFADSDSAPYGVRSSAEILALVNRAVAFLVKQHQLKALVIACNTATSIAIQQLRKRYDFPIIGMEPALKPALEIATDKAVLVCATEKTLEAPKLQALSQRLGAQKRLQRLSLQRLVTFAERQEWDSPAVQHYLQQQFAGMDWSIIQAVVLGCTHFPYYNSLLRTLIPATIPILNGHAGTVRQLQASVSTAPSGSKGSLVYYRSERLLPVEELLPYLEYLEE